MGAYSHSVAVLPAGCALLSLVKATEQVELGKARLRLNIVLVNIRVATTIQETPSRCSHPCSDALVLLSSVAQVRIHAQHRV